MGLWSQGGIDFKIVGTAPTPEEQAKINKYLGTQAAPEKSSMGSIEAGFRGAGADLATALAKGLYEAGSKETGQGILDYANAMRERTAREYKPRVTEFGQIGGASDLLNYLGNVGGQSLGYAVPMLAGSTAALFAAPEAVIPATIAGGLGYAAAGLPAYYGSNVQEQMTENKVGLGDVSSASALPAAVAQTALDVITPIKFGVLGRIGKLVGSPELAPLEKEAVERTWNEFFKTLPAETVKAATLEAGTETLQDALAVFQANPEKLYNLDSDTLNRLANSAFGGFVLGGTMNLAGLKEAEATDQSQLDSISKILNSRQKAPLAEIVAAQQKYNNQQDFISKTKQSYRDTFSKDAEAAKLEKEADDLLAGLIPSAAPPDLMTPPVTPTPPGEPPAEGTKFSRLKNFNDVYGILSNEVGTEIKSITQLDQLRNGAIAFREQNKDISPEQREQIKKYIQPLAGLDTRSLEYLYLRSREIIAQPGMSDTTREEAKIMSGLLTREFKRRERQGTIAKGTSAAEQAGATAQPSAAPSEEAATEKPTRTIDLSKYDSDQLEVLKKNAMKVLKEGGSQAEAAYNILTQLGVKGIKPPTAPKIVAPVEEAVGGVKSTAKKPGLKTAPPKVEEAAAAPEGSATLYSTNGKVWTRSKEEALKYGNVVQEITLPESVIAEKGTKTKFGNIRFAGVQAAAQAAASAPAQAPAGPLTLYSSNGSVEIDKDGNQKITGQWTASKNLAEKFAKRSGAEVKEHTFAPDQIAGVMKSKTGTYNFDSKGGAAPKAEAAKAAPKAEAPKAQAAPEAGAAMPGGRVKLYSSNGVQWTKNKSLAEKFAKKAKVPLQEIEVTEDQLSKGTKSKTGTYTFGEAGAAVPKETPAPKTEAKAAPAEEAKEPVDGIWVSKDYDIPIKVLPWITGEKDGVKWVGVMAPESSEIRYLPADQVKITGSTAKAKGAAKPKAEAKPKEAAPKKAAPQPKAAEPKVAEPKAAAETPPKKEFPNNKHTIKTKSGKTIIAPTLKAANARLNNMSEKERNSAVITDSAGVTYNASQIKQKLLQRNAERRAERGQESAQEAPKVEAKPQEAPEKAQKPKRASKRKAPPEAEAPPTPQEQKVDEQIDAKIAADAEGIKQAIMQMAVGARRFQAAALRAQAESDRAKIAPDLAKAKAMEAAAKAKRDAALKSIKDMLDRIGMKNVRPEVVATLASNNPTDIVEALYSPDVTNAGLGVIRVAENVWSPDMTLDEFVQEVTAVAAHELIHHMVKAKAFSPSEWKVLMKHARNAEAQMRGTALGVSWLERAAVIERNPKLTRDQREEQLNHIYEEAVAEAFRNFVLNGAPAAPQVKSLFRRVLGWIRGLFTYKAARANQIFEDIMSGKYNDLSYNIQTPGGPSNVQFQRLIRAERRLEESKFKAARERQRQADAAAGLDTITPRGTSAGYKQTQRRFFGPDMEEARARAEAEAKQAIEEAKRTKELFDRAKRIIHVPPKDTQFSRLLADLGDKKKDIEEFHVTRLSGTLPGSIPSGPMDMNSPAMNSILDSKAEEASPQQWIKLLKKWAGVSEGRQDELDDLGIIDMLNEEAKSGTKKISQTDILNVIDANQIKADVRYSRIPGNDAQLVQRLVNETYSTLDTEIDASNIRAQSAMQWMNLLNSWVQKGKIKKEEVDDRGLSAYLDEKIGNEATVTKSEIKELLSRTDMENSFPRQEILPFRQNVNSSWLNFSSESDNEFIGNISGYEAYTIPGGDEYAVIRLVGDKYVGTSEYHYNANKNTQAFVRLKIRDIEAPREGGGTKRVKVVEIAEVQSDLHQKARSVGYLKDNEHTKRVIELTPSELVGRDAKYNFDGLPAIDQNRITMDRVAEKIYQMARYRDPEGFYGSIIDLIGSAGYDFDGPRAKDFKKGLQSSRRHDDKIDDNTNISNLFTYKELHNINVINFNHFIYEFKFRLNNKFDPVLLADGVADDYININISERVKEHAAYAAALRGIYDSAKLAIGDSAMERIVKFKTTMNASWEERADVLEPSELSDGVDVLELSELSKNGVSSERIKFIKDHPEYKYFSGEERARRIYNAQVASRSLDDIEYLFGPNPTIYGALNGLANSTKTPQSLKNFFEKLIDDGFIYTSENFISGYAEKFNNATTKEEYVSMVLYGRRLDGSSAIPQSIIDDMEYVTGRKLSPETIAFTQLYDLYLKDKLIRLVNALEAATRVATVQDQIYSLSDIKNIPTENEMSERGITPESIAYPAMLKLPEAARIKKHQSPYDYLLRVTDENSILNEKLKMPDVPYKKSWPRVMALAAIKFGISRGADGILMDPGAVFVDRYQSRNDQRRTDGYKKFYDKDLPNVVKGIVGVSPSKIKPIFYLSENKDSAYMPYNVLMRPEKIRDIAEQEAEQFGVNFANIQHLFSDQLYEENPDFHYIELTPQMKAEVLGTRNTRYSRFSVDPSLVRQIQNDFTHVAAIDLVSKALTKAGLGADKIAVIQDRVDASFQKLQDKMVPLGRIIDSLRANGTEIPEEFDAYIQHGVMKGRTADRIMVLVENYLDPMISMMKSEIKFDGNDIESLRAVAPNYAEFVEEASYVNKGMAEAYGAAMHAPERNAAGAQRNINSTEPEDLAASGFDTEESRAARQWFEAHREYAGIKKIHGAMMDIVKEINAIRDEYQLSPDWKMMKPSEQFIAAGLPDGFRNFVPLRGVGDEDMDVDPSNPLDRKESESIKTGRGLSTSDKEDKAFLGRGSIIMEDGSVRLNRPPPFITEHLMQMAIQAVVRGEKNKVGNSVVGLLTTYADNVIDYRGRKVDLKGLAEIIYDAPMRRVLVDGVVKLLPNHQFKYEDNMLITKVRKQDGSVHEYVVKVKDKRLAEALTGSNGYGSEDAGYILSNIARVTNFMAKMATQWNPLFPITNLPRDLAGALINLQEHNIEGLTKNVLKGTPSAFKALWKYQTHNTLRYLATGEKAPREEHIVDGVNWTDILKRFQKAGGDFSIYGNYDIKEMANEINKRISPDPSNLAKSKEVLERVGNFIESYNKSVENAIRLATFKAMIEAGATDTQAAYAAKNVTTNYDRGGTMKSKMTALWMFYNANVQGNMTILNAMVRSPRVRGIVGGVIVAGLMQDMIMSLLAGEDDETGDNKYDQIPDHVLQSKAIFFDPTGTTENGFISWPMPYGYNAAHNFGRALGRFMRGRYEVGEALSTMFGTLVESVNPMGGSSSILSFAAPTILDPVVELSLNRDWANRPIYKEANPFDPDIPLSLRHFNDTSFLSKTFTSMLHNITGGTPGREGLIEWSPDIIDYLFRYYGSGVGAAVGQTTSFFTDTIPKMLAGEEWETREIPGVSKFFGNVGTRGDTEKFYKIVDETKRAKNELKIATESKDYEAIRDAIKNNKEMLQLNSIANTLGNSRKQIASRIKQIDNNPKIPESRKIELTRPLKERIKQIERNLIKQYNMRIRDAEVQ